MASTYVLITPARNEADHIDKTLDSVISQTILPAQWVIVSDASDDGTDQIVEKYAKQHDWIKLVRRSDIERYNFASKVACFNLGLSNLDFLDYHHIGNIDGDISLDPDHFEFLLKFFSDNPRYGVLGVTMREDKYDPLRDSFFSEEDVFGACQFFQRECFEAIGGYLPIQSGGVDWAAVRMARMNGWKTLTFRDRFFFHHGIMGAGEYGVLYARFDYGRKDYLFRNHPLWEFCRILFQMSKRPFLLGGLLIFAGYFSALIHQVRCPFPNSVIRYHRKEQLSRLANLVRSVLKIPSNDLPEERP